MSTHFKKFKFPISAIILAATIFAFFFLYRQIGKENQKAEEIAVATQNETIKRDELRLLDRSLSTVRGDRILLSTHFAESSNIVPFLNEIENAGRKADVAVEVVNVDAQNDGAFLSVKISADGSFKALYTFITLLEHSPYALEFTALTLEQGLVDTNLDPALRKPTLWHTNMTLKLLTYVK